MLKYIVVFITLLICSVKTEESCRKDGKIVVCYWASWAVYRPGAGFMNTSHIVPEYCTHLVYTFAGLNAMGNSIVSLDPGNDFAAGNGRDSYRTFVQLKQQRPCLKTLLAVGGWNEMSRKYSVVAYTPESRKQFAASIVRYLVTYEFDGVDFDWEYPTQRGGIPEDNNNFIELLKELKAQLKPWNMLLSVAVAVTTSVVEEAYNVPEIANTVDYISLMAYDYTSALSETTGLLAPLHSTSGNDIENSVNLWIKKNCPPEKLVLGIPMYARSYKIKDPKKCTSELNCGIGIQTEKNTFAGKFTRELGFLSNYELAEHLRLFKYTQVLSKVEQTYFAFNGTYWLTYDNEDTIKAKVKFAVDKNLGGVMAWSIDTDDFRPIFSKEKFPLLRAINDALDGQY